MRIHFRLPVLRPSRCIVALHYVSIRLYFLFIAGILYSTSSFSIDARLNWHTLQTPHFLIHYPDNHSELAKLIAGRAEDVHTQLTPWFTWQPAEKTHIVLNTSASRANGSAFSIPYNRIELHTVIPGAENSLSDFADWWSLIITHEYAHILHLDKKAGLPLFLYNALGRIPAFYPNLYQPRWIIEGLATYIETDKRRQIGRGQSSAFKMAINEELAGRFKPLRQVNLHGNSWPYNTPYLYGSYFFEFLEQEYSATHIKRFIAEYSDNVIPFSLNSTSHKVFHKSFYALWIDYEHYLRTHLSAKGPINTPSQALTKNGFLTGPLKGNKEGALFYIEDNGKRQPTLRQINRTGAATEITTLQHNASFDIHASGKILISQPEVCEEYNIYYDLFILDNGNNQPRQITHCGQYHYASWHPSGDTIAAIKVMPLYSRIDLLKSDGSLIKTLWSSDENTRLSTLDWNGHGDRIVTTQHKEHEGWNIYELDVNTAALRNLTDGSAIKSSPRYTHSGSIIYSADYDGISNIYELDPQTKHIKSLTQDTKGKTHPHLIENNGSGQLAYLQYGTSGFDIYLQKEIEKRPYSPEANAAKKPDKPSVSTLTYMTASSYSPWPSLLTPSWIPNFFVSSEQTYTGAILMGADALQLQRYAVSVAYEADYQQLYTSINYQFNDRLFLNYKYDNLYFFSEESLDLVLHEHQLEAYYRIPYSQLTSQWELLLGVEIIYGDWENLTTSLITPDNDHGELIGAAVIYNNSQRYIRGISSTEGRQVYLAVENIRPGKSSASGNSLTIDWREYIPIVDTHTLALRGVYAESSSTSVRYFLGGDNSDPFGSISNIFNRRDYPLRGYDKSFNTRSGNRLVLTSAEWRFPVSNTESTTMSPPIGLQKIHGKLFVDSGASWSEGINGKTFFSSAGFEFIAKTKLFYHYPANVRLGYAKTEETTSDNFYGSLGISF